MHIERQHPQGSRIGVTWVCLEGLCDLMAGRDGGYLGESGGDDLQEGGWGETRWLR